MYRIHSLSVGNGRIGISHMPGRNRDLEGDIQAIRAWGAAIVVSMTTNREMAESGVAHIAELLTAVGIQWEHLPIRDFGGPDGKSAGVWRALSETLHARLDEGDAVLLHCRGGQGRSGMIALRLMVECGEDVDAALQRLRAVRPGAVETDEQLDWARRGLSGGRFRRFVPPAG